MFVRKNTVNGFIIDFDLTKCTFKVPSLEELMSKSPCVHSKDPKLSIDTYYPSTLYILISQAIDTGIFPLPITMINRYIIFVLTFIL